MTSATYLIEPLTLPETIDAPDAADFHEFGRLCDALTLETWGSLDRATAPPARLRFWRDNAYTRMRIFFVRVDGRMAAKSWIRFEQQENLGRALLHVAVLRAYAGRGIGRALLQHAEELAAADGRSVLMSFTEHPADFDADGPDVIAPLTGTGALPAAARGVRFAAAAGYRLEQVERFSSLDLAAAAPALDRLERDARARAAGYELLTWTDRCPDEHVEQLARADVTDEHRRADGRPQLRRGNLGRRTRPACRGHLETGRQHLARGCGPAPGERRAGSVLRARTRAQQAVARRAG